MELPNLSDLILKNGSHRDRAAGVCLLEAVAWFAGEKHSDQPQCVDRALAAFGRAFNDRLRDDERQLLKPLIPKLVGTAGSPELMRRRAYLLVDRHVRVNMPAFMRSLPNKPRPDLAERFEALSPVIDGKSAELARDCAREVRDEARKSWPAAAADDADAAAAAAADDADAAAAAAADDADDAADAAADAAAAADDAAAADAWKQFRHDTIARSISAFVEAIELTEVQS